MTMPNDPLPPVLDLRGIENAELDPTTIAILERIAAGDQSVQCLVVRDGDSPPPPALD